MADTEPAVTEPAEDKTAENVDIKEWTVMFFFAGDNALSPLIVAQLKAIKDAGFHPDVNVLAHFDSNEVGVPIKILDVNRKRKKEMQAERPSRPFKIGDEGDPFIHDMEDDTIKVDDIDPKAGEASASVLRAMKSADSVSALKALNNFVGFCGENFKARNYLLLLVGHGLVVGHDTFLPDDNPASAVKLSEMREGLVKFNGLISKHGGTLQLLALHSCSMSAIEVAYELRDQAKYMMGSEGISYIGSWPYRQLLMKLFRNVVNAANAAKGGEHDSHEEDNGGAERPARRHRVETVDELIEKLYELSYHNATDYMLSGYSLDLSLCSLDKANYEPLTGAIKELVRRMKTALDESVPPEESVPPDEKAVLDGKCVRGQVIRELILLAHWESQSYWNESFTDLFDFCQCLKKRCDSLLEMLKNYTDAAKTGAMHDDLFGLAGSCFAVMNMLSVTRPPELAERSGPIVIRSRFSGPLYQYSHGLSVYFPWSRPVDDGPKMRILVLPDGEQVEDVSAEEVMVRYRKYIFNSEMEGESWADFLDSYFDKTQRLTRKKEDGDDKLIDDERDFERFNNFGTLAGNPMAALTKGSPSTGVDCDCASIKNYPKKPKGTDTGKSRLVKAY